MTDPESQQIRSLVERCLDGWEDEGPEIVSRLCRERPELESKVRSRLKSLRQLGLLGDADEPETPQRLGDFRLQRKLGSGGMGVVYVAVQESLDREVALKLVRPDLLLFADAKQRFHREVAAVSRLDHPGIVKVFAYGNEAGVPYFAMELVRGCTLAEMIAQLAKRAPNELRRGDLTTAVRERLGETATASTDPNDWVRTVFEIVETVADALEHAHERGVLHRDVKPGNIMVTASGRPLLLDFSLARTEQTGGDMTRSGAMLGSLPYMAPEQVLGDHRRVDERTDVYGLGVTLYELLTLRSPYLDADLERTRERILEGRPLPVTRLNPRVPWDAETVCLKAMDVDARRRYRSAAEFMQDVRNFLDHRPVHARRPSPILLVRRAAQRHPATATAIVIGLLLAIGGPIAYGILQRAHVRDVKVALDASLAAISAMRKTTSDKRLDDLPFVDELRRDYLAAEIAAYEKLQVVRSVHPPVSRSMVLSLLRIANYRRLLGELEAAQRDVLAAIDLLDDVAMPERLRADAWRQRGAIARLRLQGSEALRCCERAVAEYERIFERDPTDRRAVSELALAESNVAMLAAQQGESERAVATIRRAIARYEAILAKSKDDDGLAVEVARCIGIHGSVLHITGASLAVVLRPYRKGLRLIEEVKQRSPEDPTVVREYVAQHLNLGNLLIGGRRYVAAKEAFRKAVDACRVLRRLNPSRPKVISELARALSSLARATNLSRGGEDPEPLLKEALELQLKLTKRFPGVSDFEHNLAMIRAQYGAYRVDIEDYAGAEPLYAAAVRALGSLAETASNRSDALFNYGLALCQSQLVQEELGRTERALANCLLARKAFLRAAETKPRRTLIPALRLVLLEAARLTALTTESPRKAVPFLDEAIRLAEAKLEHLEKARSWPILGGSDALRKLLERAPR